MRASTRDTIDSGLQGNSYSLRWCDVLIPDICCWTQKYLLLNACLASNLQFTSSWTLNLVRLVTKLKSFARKSRIPELLKLSTYVWVEWGRNFNWFYFVSQVLPLSLLIGSENIASEAATLRKISWHKNGGVFSLLKSSAASRVYRFVQRAWEETKKRRSGKVIYS